MGQKNKTKIMGSLEVKVNENIVHETCGIYLKQYSGTFIINFKRNLQGT